MTQKEVSTMMTMTMLRDKFIVIATIKRLTCLKVREALMALNGVTSTLTGSAAANDFFYDVESLANEITQTCTRRCK